MSENIIYFAYDFNIIVNGALVRELEGTPCAYRCWGRSGSLISCHYAARAPVISYPVARLSANVVLHDVYYMVVIMVRGYQVY